MLTFLLLSLACAAAAVAIGLECNNCDCQCDFCTRSFSDADTSSFAETPTKGRCYLNNESLGDWRIVSGKLEVVTPTTEAIIRSNEPSDNYGGISVDITITAVGQQPGICIRDNYSSDYRYLYLDEGTSNVVHGTWVSGVRTEVAVPVSVTFTVGSTYTLKFIPYLGGAQCGGTREVPWSVCNIGDYFPASFPSLTASNGALWIDGNYECAIGSGFAPQQPGLYLRNVNATSPQWDNLIIHKRWPAGGSEGCNQMPSQCHGCCECGSMPLAVEVDLSGITTGTTYDCDWLVYLLTQQTYCLDEVEASGRYADTLTEPFEYKCGYARWNCSGDDAMFDAVTGLSCPSIGTGEGCEPSASGCEYSYYGHISASRHWNHETQRCEWGVCLRVLLSRHYLDAPLSYDVIAEGWAFYRYDGGDDSGPQCADRDPVTLTLWEDFPLYIAYGDALVTWPATITLTPSDTPCGACGPPPTTTTTTTTTTPPACVDYACDIICNDPGDAQTGTWAQSGDENCASQGGDCSCGVTGPSGDFLEGGDCGAGCAAECHMAITSRTVMGVPGFYWTDAGECTNGTVSCNCHYLRTAVGRGYAVHDMPADATDIGTYFGLDLVGSCYVNGGEVITGACRI